MFIGEMGCWLIVGLINLYQKYISKPSSGYQPIGTSAQESGVVDAEGERIHDGIEDLQPITKVMSKNDDRIPIRFVLVRKLYFVDL